MTAERGDELYGAGAPYARYTLDDYTSADAEMRRCLELARVAARTDLPVLILGESGTGKTLLAHAIHNSSRRARHPFVAFNAAALSDTLLDSQLFGHERGAFTGAHKRVKGKFELAHLGTLFIDEIADMSAAAQAKILRAVEYGEFERLGSETLQVAAVRLISATHLPISRFLESEHFRKDLFYRIGGITVPVPSLRERPNDLRALIAVEIAAASRQQGKAITGLSKTSAEQLLSYAWPGNLRELRQVIHCAVALSDGDTILPQAILIAPNGDAAAATAVPAPALATRRAAAVRSRADLALDGAAPAPTATDLSLALCTRRHIDHVLELTGGNKRQAAQLLGMARSTLDRKLGHPPLEPARDVSQNAP